MKKLALNLMFAVVIAALSQSVFAQKKAAPPKKLLVQQLVEKTYRIFPVKILSGALEDTKGKLAETFKEKMTATLNTEIDARKDVSEERKTAAKSKVPELAEKMAARLDFIVRRNFTPVAWVKESLRQNYTKKLSVGDLRKLNAFFGKPDAKRFVAAFARELDHGEENDSSEAAKKKFEDSPAFAKFEKSGVALKFLNSFFDDSDYLNAKIEKWSNEMSKTLDVDMDKGEFKQLIADFMKTNLQ